MTGHNGSGKSTLLKMLSGGLSPSEGKLNFVREGKELSQVQIAEEVTYAAPYIHLIDDFTLQEMLEISLSFQRSDSITANSWIYWDWKLIRASLPRSFIETSARLSFALEFNKIRHIAFWMNLLRIWTRKQYNGTGICG